MKYQNILEEELKNCVCRDFFHAYDWTKIIGKIDFCISEPYEGQEEKEMESYIWAEAKKKVVNDHSSIVQLILTIGKARTYDKYFPPIYLGSIDAEKITLIPYSKVSDIFYMNDFNWNVTPSNHETREFKLVQERVKAIIDENALIFNFEDDAKELTKFINNLRKNKVFGENRLRVDKNNFMHVYTRWLKEVKNTISVDWNLAKKAGIIDGDFYLADLLSNDNISLKEKLYVLLKSDHYELARKVNSMGMFESQRADFVDNKKAHTQFWNKYIRPPQREYWDYIVERRDLLVPQDVRERQGSFFTPSKWVELSQQYLADTLGENWQDEYYIWDCAAGTGNLLAGLLNKDRIFASTLAQQDVDAMLDRISNGANLKKSHVFQFDFLNDSFANLPQPLQDIIKDEEKRKKLIIYINPPYKEATNARVPVGNGENAAGVATDNETYRRYRDILGRASNEVFAQFFIRVYQEMPGATLAEFSTLKILQASAFADFRKIFKAKLENLFIVPANTFDNVKGQFPIGFFIWNTQVQEEIGDVTADVYDKDGNYSQKRIAVDNGEKYISTWLINNTKQLNSNNEMGTLIGCGTDFQHSKYCTIQDQSSKSHYTFIALNINTLIVSSIYISVRHCIEATWLNDRDQFLYPNDSWKEDKEFQSNCLAFTLFHGQNRISSKEGTNHWIPFTEEEVDAQRDFTSHFMTDFIKGKIKTEQANDMFSGAEAESSAIEFSPEAKAVFEAGKEVWRYYHNNYKNIGVYTEYNPNVSLYDIKLHFKGVRGNRMNNRSRDETFNALMDELGEKLKALGACIAEKVYEYGFLKR